MRLYLSSYGIGNHPEELVRLVGAKKKAAIIANAGDLDTAYRSTGVEKQHTLLRGLGFTSEEIDLRNFFNDHNKLKSTLSNFNLIWVRGGNAFVLQRAFEQSGFNKILPDLLKQDVLVYGGYSAGAIVISPTLKGIDLVDDPTSIPSGYRKEFSWNGIGLIPYSLVPHFQSNHPESEKINQVVEYLKQHNLQYKTLADGQVLVIDGSQEKLVS